MCTLGVGVVRIAESTLGITVVGILNCMMCGVLEGMSDGALEG